VRPSGQGRRTDEAHPLSPSPRRIGVYRRSRTDPARSSVATPSARPASMSSCSSYRHRHDSTIPRACAIPAIGFSRRCASSTALRRNSSGLAAGIQDPPRAMIASEQECGKPGQAPPLTRIGLQRSNGFNCRNSRVPPSLVHGSDARVRPPREPRLPRWVAWSTSSGVTAVTPLWGRTARWPWEEWALSAMTACVRVCGRPGPSDGGGTWSAAAGAEHGGVPAVTRFDEDGQPPAEAVEVASARPAPVPRCAPVTVR
jgi:hypothetical protein